MLSFNTLTRPSHDHFDITRPTLSRTLLRLSSLYIIIFFGTGPLSVFATENNAGSASDTDTELSVQRFQHPPQSAHVHVWWHWMDGAITQEGITKDLEGMKAQGVAEATILNVGLFKEPMSKAPRVPFASPKWFEMYRWALTEAARLGITIGVHNCDGWSSSGGPWITPEMSMKQFTWTKTIVEGGEAVDVVLPKPFELEAFYKDVAVVAYPTTETTSVFRNSDLRLTVNDSSASPAPITDGNPVSELRIRRGDRLVLSSQTPLKFGRIAINLRRTFMWSDPALFTSTIRVETSDDGTSYKECAILSTKGLNSTEILKVRESSAKFVRLTIQEMSEADSWLPIGLSELELLNGDEVPAFAPTIINIEAKTSSIKAAAGAVNAKANSAPAIAAKDIINLTGKLDASGKVHVDLPSGKWAILRLGYTSTGARNNPATPEGVGLECDKMDSTAVDKHFQAFPQRLIDEAGDAAEKTLRFILVDSWEAGFQNWTARFPDEFQSRRGYDIISWLPVLTGQTVSSVEESEAVLYDFRQTIADLIREKYYDHFSELLHHRGIELHAEVIYGGADYPPLDVLLATRNVDMPMMEFWAGANKESFVEYNPHDFMPYSIPVSAAYGYGKRLVGSEAYTGFAHYSEAPADLAPFGNRAYAGGVNRMILHSSVHQPDDDKPGLTLGQFGSHFNRNNLYWSHAASWLEYQARIQSMLGLGFPVYDALYLLGDQLPQAYERNDATAAPPGYAVTAINGDLLSGHVAVQDGELTINGLRGASIISLPQSELISLTTLKRLRDLIESGAHVYGSKPKGTLSRSDLEKREEFTKLSDQIWGDGKDSFGTKAFGKGRVSWGRTLGDVLKESEAPQFHAVPDNTADFVFTHRRVGSADVFFVANQTTQRVLRECLFKVKGMAPEIWNPETGAVLHPALFQVEGNQLRLPLRFEPRQSLLIVFKDPLPQDFIRSVSQGARRLFPKAESEDGEVPSLTFDGMRVRADAATGGLYNFQTQQGKHFEVRLESAKHFSITPNGVVLLSGAGIEPPHDRIDINGLNPLTDTAVPSVKYFSGEATYQLKFKIDSFEKRQGEKWLLDLGGFESIATVSLNGQQLGQFWKTGIPIDITKVVQADNELTVQVVNVYRNRLIGDLAEFGEIRNLHTSSPIKQFLSAESPLKPSGLWGPILITRILEKDLPLDSPNGR